jgi:Tfp pilus assembly protein PilX
MSRLRRRIAGGEEGMAVITVLLISVVMSMLLATMTQAVMQELDHSAAASTRSLAFQAAEAGVDDYTAKLAEDTQYYLHQVAAGESTRNTTYGPLSTWTGATSWSYTGTNWRNLPSNNGYQYNLEVTAPSASQTAVTIVATGRAVGASKGYRRIQVLIQPASIVDFQMIADANISYGPTATTTGKIYAGVGHSVNHDGTATADLYSEGSITGSTTLNNGAQKYDSSTIRSKLPSPISFSSFTGSLVDLKSAAQAGGIYLPLDNTINGYKLVFNASGTVDISKCTMNSGHLAAAAPTCVAYLSLNMPLNGAIYSEQSVVVSGTVNGIETVGVNGDIVIGGDITYLASGSDVLGLIAQNNVYVAAYVNNSLDWRASTISQTGTWSSYGATGSKTGTMTFTGSTATKLGGQMAMFNTRVYNYDPTLLYLRPPFFPFIDKAYTITLFREIPSGAP